MLRFPSESFPRVLDGNWIMVVGQVNHPRFNKCLVVFGSLSLHPGSSLSHQLWYPNRRPLLAVNQLSNFVLEIPIAHQIRFCDQKNLCGIEMGTPRDNFEKAIDEIVEVDERLPVIRIAREKMTFQLCLLNTRDLLGKRNCANVFVIHATDA